MREGEAARRRHALGDDRRAQQLGQLDQLGDRLGVRDRIAGDEQRPLGAGQTSGRLVDRLAVADDARRHARGGAEVEVALRVEDVDRQREEHGTGRMGQRGLHRAPHDARQVLQAMRLGRPLRVRPRHRWQIGPEDRLRHGEALVVLAGCEQHRRARFVGVVEHPHRVAEAGGDVHVHRGEAAAGLRVAVGHRDGHGLLQRQHVADAGLAGQAVHERQLRGAGVAEHDGDAFLLQDLEERLLAGEEWHSGGIINPADA